MPGKICYCCKEIKALESFRAIKTNRDGRHSYCRICENTKNQEIRRRTQEMLQGRVYSYLLLHPCVDCGESDPIVLDFDHVYGEKDRCVSEMVDDCCTWQKIEVEITKCVVRCANCHRRVTASRLGFFRSGWEEEERQPIDQTSTWSQVRWRKRKVAETSESLRSYLVSHPCTACGEKDPRILDFDHVRGEKSMGVVTLVTRGHSWDRILKEIEKCEVRCANCHRRITAQRAEWYRARRADVREG